MKYNYEYIGKPYISEKDIMSVVDALSNNHLNDGYIVSKFERKLCEYTGSSYAICVDNGSNALVLALRALGVGLGDEVITTPISFVATTNAVQLVGAKPIFVDINPKTFNMDEKYISKKITSNTKAILPVEFAGLPVDYDFYQNLEKKYGIPVLVDSAQSLSAKYKGKKIGSISKISTTSFHPTKPITTGVGGAIFTNDSDLALKLKLLRNNGLNDMRKNGEFPYPYDQELISSNYKMSDINASLGISQLSKIDWMKGKRKKISEFYDTEFKAIASIEIQEKPKGHDSSYHLYPIVFSSKKVRNNIFRELTLEKISVQIHYRPIFLNSLYLREKKDCKLSNAVDFGNKVLSIPIHSNMNLSDAYFVCNKIKFLMRK